MENEKEGNDNDRESYGFKISELLKPLAVQKSPHSNTLHSSSLKARTTLHVQVITGCTPGLCATFGSRAFLPENICMFSKGRFKKQASPLTSSAPVPAPSAGRTSSKPTGQEGQVHSSLVSSDAIFLACLVAKNTALPSDSLPSIGEKLRRGEICPHILGLQAWNKQPICEAWWRTQAGQTSLQTGPTTEWFFEDLADFQRKLLLGGLQKSETSSDLHRQECFSPNASHIDSAASDSPDKSAFSTTQLEKNSSIQTYFSLLDTGIQP